MRSEDLTPEQLEKIKDCGADGGRPALMAEDGVGLADEQLEGVAGGAWGDGDICPDGREHEWVRTGRQRTRQVGMRQRVQHEMRCKKLRQSALVFNWLNSVLMRPGGGGRRAAAALPGSRAECGKALRVTGAGSVA